MSPPDQGGILGAAIGLGRAILDHIPPPDPEARRARHVANLKSDLRKVRRKLAGSLGPRKRAHLEDVRSRLRDQLEELGEIGPDDLGG